MALDMKQEDKKKKNTVEKNVIGPDNSLGINSDTK